MDFKIKAQELMFLINTDKSNILLKSLNYIDNLNHICDFISHYFILNINNKMNLYKETDIEKRCYKLSSYINAIITRLS